VTRGRTTAFVLLLAALVAVPLGTIAWKEYRLATGEHVVLRVQPVDPHDPFRGEYVALSYPISRLTIDDMRRGETLYVPLRRVGGEWRKAGPVSRERPDDGVFIRGRVADGGIEYGIETFYVEEGKAIEYERALASGNLFAEVALDEDGGAQLDDLVVRSG
jgi:uncharacterized membrane-anchored protein